MNLHYTPALALYEGHYREELLVTVDVLVVLLVLQVERRLIKFDGIVCDGPFLEMRKISDNLSLLTVTVFVGQRSLRRLLHR